MKSAALIVGAALTVFGASACSTQEQTAAAAPAAPVLIGRERERAGLG